MSSPGTIVATDGRTLPLIRTRIRARARAGVARVVLEQTFHNPHEAPLRVSYQVPFPARGAVSGQAFVVGDRRITGEVDKRSTARDRFEEALMEGRTAALLEQDRSSVFEQEVGNVPPGTDVVVELTVDQPLDWLPEGAWEWRFPTVVAPRYHGAEGRVPDAGRLHVDVAEGSVGARLALDLHVGDTQACASSLAAGSTRPPPRGSGNRRR